MKYLNEVKYIQVYVSKNMTIYYNMETGGYVRYVMRETWRPSICYYIGIPITLFVGNVFDPYYKMMVVMHPSVQVWLLLLSIAIGFLGFMVSNKMITKLIDEKGYPILESFVDKNKIQLGIQQIRQQCRIIMVFIVVDVVLLAFVYVTKILMIWMIFVIFLLCTVMFAESARPRLRRKILSEIMRGDKDEQRDKNTVL